MRWGQARIEVLPSVDLLQVVRHYTEPRAVPGGRRWEALCPVHDDNSPSLHVWPGAKGIGLWKCYPCGKGGDAADFVAWVEGWTRADAIAHLSGNDGQVLQDTLTQAMAPRKVPLHMPPPRVRVSWVDVVRRLQVRPWWTPGEEDSC